MTEEEKAVKTEVQPAATEQTPDYKALLEKANEEKENYKKGLLKAKKGEIELDEEKMDDLATRVAAKITPDLKSSLVSTVAKNDLDSKLDKLTTNKDEQELIRYHFEYSTAGEDIDARLQNAYAITNQDLIKRKAQEIQLAQTHKTTTSTSMGSSSESGIQTTKDDYFTPDQIKDLEKRYAAAGLKLDLNKVKENMERAKRGEGMNLHPIK